MRTNIVLDDELVKEGMRLLGCKTKKELVHRSLEETIRLAKQKGILRLRGKVPWQGNFDAMRRWRP